MQGEQTCVIAASRLGQANMTDPVLIEPVPLQDIFCEGIGRIQIVGQNARFFLYIGNGTDGMPERMVVARVVIPLENLPEAIRMAMEVTIGHTSEKITGTLRKMAGLH